MTDLLFNLLNTILSVCMPIVVLNLTIITISYFGVPLIEAWTEKKRQDRQIWEAETDSRLERLERERKLKNNDS